MPKNNSETVEDVQQADITSRSREVIEDVNVQQADADDGAIQNHPAVESSPAIGEEPDSEIEDGKTFPREYVEQLRGENARYRTQAKTAEGLGKRLHVALTAATGRLADPTDMPFDEAHLEDPDALATAIDALIESKPHLKSRRVTGDVGQGASPSQTGDVDLLGILRERAN